MPPSPLGGGTHLGGTTHWGGTPHLGGTPLRNSGIQEEFKGILHQEVGVASAPQDLPSTRAGGQDDGS